MNDEVKTLYQLIDETGDQCGLVYTAMSEDQVDELWKEYAQNPGFNIDEFIDEVLKEEDMFAERVFVTEVYA
jgi:hypothetical protein